MTEFYQWANSAKSGLSLLFPATLLLHERLNNDPELVDQITGFRKTGDAAWFWEHSSDHARQRGAEPVSVPGFSALNFDFSAASATQQSPGWRNTHSGLLHPGFQDGINPDSEIGNI